MDKLEVSLAIYMTVLGEDELKDSEELCNTYTALSSVLKELGRLKESKQFEQKANSIMEERETTLA